jgi:sialic acid synthase SpsE
MHLYNNLYKTITPPHHMVKIVAEAAQGFDGNPVLAELIVKGAIEADADAIKFQLVYGDELASPDYKHYERWKRIEMKDEVWQKIVDITHDAGKEIYFDVFGERSLNLSKQTGADGVYIHATDFYNTSLIKKTLQMNFNKVFISIGGIPISDVEDLVKVESLSKHQNICLVHGFQALPTPLQKTTPLHEHNILRLNSLRKKFPQFQLMFMDHSHGLSEDSIYLSVAALATEVEYIEKHISLDPLLKLQDSDSALPPKQFKEFVRVIKKYEKALGSPDTNLSFLENHYRIQAMKAIVPNRDLKAGESLHEKDLSLKRVKDFRQEFHLHKLKDAIGKTLKVSAKKNQALRKENIQ